MRIGDDVFFIISVEVKDQPGRLAHFTDNNIEYSVDDSGSVNAYRYATG